MSDKVKLIIEIPKYYLEHPQDYTCLAECVRRGTPIPDNATNGDVIKAMFDVEEYHLKTEPDDVALRFKGEERTIWFSLDWWNALYQKGGKE